MVVGMMATALGVVFPQTAGATGCDNNLGPIQYGDDVKPPDICVRVAGVQEEVAANTPQSGAVNAWQLTCVLNLCQTTGVYVEAIGTPSAGANELVCSGSTFCVTAGAEVENGTPHAHVCYMSNFDEICVVNFRAAAE
jgi:hypothetical protein